MTDELQPQTLPVRVYQTFNRIMVAAPMPGLEPENITITIAGTRVVIQGELRGENQDELDLLLNEWNVGPYHRELTLPEPVSGPLTNATYGNGVLVLSMPKVGRDEEGVEITFQLERLEQPTRGERVGHEGLAIEPTTTEEDRRERAETAQGAGKMGETSAERLERMEEARRANVTDETVGE